MDEIMSPLSPEGKILNHRLIRVIHSGSKTVSHLAKDDKGNKYLITAVDRDRVLKKLQYKAFLKGDMSDELDKINMEADEKILIIENELKEVALRTKDLDNEHIARIYNVGFDQSRRSTVVISEYIPGFDFFLATKGLSPLQMISLFVQALKGLSFVHLCGFLHLNIKASRIRVDVEGEPPIVKLTDFGFAVPKDKFDGEFLGTSLYMAPEIILSQLEKVSEHTDLYSFGVLMYYCLTGRCPTGHRLVGGHSKEELIRSVEHEEIFSPPKHLNEEIPDELNNIVMGLLEKSPDRRAYHHAEELINSMREIWPKESVCMPHDETSTLCNEEVI